MKIKKIITGKNKKSQHEIVGFILIVVIVVIIGLFLLVFYLRQTPVQHESLDVQNFLQASMLYTTECAISYEPQYESLQDLIKSCYINQQCLDGEMACNVLNSILAGLVHESWLASENKPVNGYSLIIYYEELGEDEEMSRKDEILKLQENWQNCTGSRTGAEHLIYYHPGNIIISMEVCYII